MAPLRESKETGNDGGFFALLGFTQQMLGSAAQFVQCLSPTPPPNSTEWEIVQSFEIETHGQDATFISSRLVLTQFKFSTNPNKYPIRNADLERIATSFEDSERICRELSIKPTTRVLRSNRPVGKRVQLDRYGIVYSPYDPIDARRDVEDYAKQFGISEPAELDESVSRVIGKLISIGARIGSHRMTREQFHQTLTGASYPLSIAIETALPRMRDNLEEFQHIEVGVNAEFAERSQFTKAMNQITDDALIVFTGKGGYGKTTALWQFLRAVIDTDSASPRLVHIVTSAPHPPSTFGILVDSLRGIHSLQHDDLVALHRIEAANPKTAPPFLFLGWDGIDQIHETPGWVAASSAMIRFFWKLHQEHKDTGLPPPARLLVSCRRRDEFDRRILTSTGLEVERKRPTYIEFDVFDDSELISLLRPLDESVTARLLAVLDQGPMQSLDAVYTSNIETDDASARASINTLRQPIMWHFFSKLSTPMQAAFLDGDSRALATVARSYVTWFGNRVSQRHGLDPQELELGLDELARTFPTATAANSTTHCHHCLANILQPSHARLLYKEGVSSGLLDEIPPSGGYTSSGQSKWHWRHPFVVAYLLNHEGLNTNG